MSNCQIVENHISRLNHIISFSYSAPSEIMVSDRRRSTTKAGSCSYFHLLSWTDSIKPGLVFLSFVSADYFFISCKTVDSLHCNISLWGGWQSTSLCSMNIKIVLFKELKHSRQNILVSIVCILFKNSKWVKLLRNWLSWINITRNVWNVKGLITVYHSHG